MKVTITCEKCGGKILEGGGYQDAPHIARRFSNGPALECPNCSKLTYGPLTEEMVAAALAEVVAEEEDCSQPMELYRGQARFVLRLLNELDDTRIEYESTWPDEWFSGPPVESWLLKLAREK